MDKSVKSAANLLAHQIDRDLALQDELTRYLVVEGTLVTDHLEWQKQIADATSGFDSIIKTIKTTFQTLQKQLDSIKMMGSLRTNYLNSAIESTKMVVNFQTNYINSVNSAVKSLKTCPKDARWVAKSIGGIRTVPGKFVLPALSSINFPNIIPRLSVNPNFPLIPEQRRTPLLEPPSIETTSEVYEEIPPDTISTPWPESVLPKTNGKAADKRFFIGHGRSDCWKELRDFIEEVLGLPHDEFNRVSTAGLATTERLRQMTDQVDMAFLIMTGENQYADGTWHARENVVHEIGLFQGALDFKKAIILLEEGCEEFSNIHGLGQIRFPKGNIKAAFEEICQVLEREGIL